MLNSISLFSGYEGIGLGLEGYARPILYCEIESYAQGILLSRTQEELLPFAPIWPDVTNLNGKIFRGMVDLIHGGFPCQDISVAGTGKGLAGKRSGLFREIIRIAKESKAPFIFLENVPNIRTKGAWIVQRELSRLGYDTRWTTVSAAQVGANHKRERWFCLAFKKQAMANPESLGLQGLWTSREQVAHSHGQEGLSVRESENLSDTNVQGCGREADATKKKNNKRKRKSNGWPMSSANQCDWWETEPSIHRVVDGDSFRLDEIKSILGALGSWAKGIWRRVDGYFRADRVRACGNGVVPLQARVAFEYLSGISCKK